MAKNLMHIFFLSCLKATEIIEKRLYFELSLKEKLQLKIHKMMCDACSRYEKQSLFIDQAIKASHSVRPGIDIKPAQEEIIRLKKHINEKITNL